MDEKIIQPIKISDSLLSKTAFEKSDIKSTEIAKLDCSGDYIKDDIKIEIIGEVKKIEVNGQAGVEVFAKGWKDGEQLGFGKDGSVEIERFRIFNPPILVDDPNGDIERPWSVDNADGTKLEGIRKLREDPLGAIRDSLVHTIKIIGKDSSNIVKGKIGNTTSTFYPNAGTSTAPVDGAVRRAEVNESFSSIRNGSGNAVEMVTGLTPGELGASGTADQFIRSDRLLYGFNISIGTDQVDSATFSLYGYGKSTGIGTTNVEITTVTPGNNDTVTTFANSDYNIANYGSSLLATGIDIATGWSTTGYNDFALNASGKAYVTNGIRYFAARNSWDVNNSFTGTWVSGQETRGLARAADESGTTNDPKLVVVHSAAAGGTVNAANVTSKMGLLGVGC